MRSASEELVGLVLAGGASRRMGVDKAALVLDPGDPHAPTLAALAAGRLQRCCSRVLIADRGREFVARSLAQPVADGPGAGPAAGILGAAAVFPRASLLVLACDLPAADAALLRRVLAVAAEDPGVSWVLTRDDDGLQPLCALYRPAVLAALAQQVSEGHFALRKLAKCREVRWRAVDAGPAELVNINTPADVARFRSRGG